MFSQTRARLNDLLFFGVIEENRNKRAGGKKSSKRRRSAKAATAKRADVQRREAPTPKKRAAPKHHKQEHKRPRKRHTDTTAKRAEPKPHKKRARKKADDCPCDSPALEKRRRARRRKTERMMDVGKNTFASTKRRLGLNDMVNDGEETPLLENEHVELADCFYGAESGLADKEPTTLQAEKINRINERLVKFEEKLRTKYRAFYSPRSERSYVVRKYVGNSDALDNFGDALLKYRPIGIGGKTLDRVFHARHGVRWDDFASSAKTDSEIRSMLSEKGWTNAQEEMRKAESRALRARNREESAKAKAAKTAVKKAGKELDKQEEKVEEAKKRVVRAKKEAKATPTKTKKEAVRKAEKSVKQEEKKEAVLEKKIETLEKKAEATESNASNQEASMQAAVLQKLMAKYG